VERLRMVRPLRGASIGASNITERISWSKEPLMEEDDGGRRMKKIEKKLRSRSYRVTFRRIAILLLTTNH